MEKLESLLSKAQMVYTPQSSLKLHASNSLGNTSRKSSSQFQKLGPKSVQIKDKKMASTSKSSSSAASSRTSTKGAVSDTSPISHVSTAKVKSFLQANRYAHFLLVFNWFTRILLSMFIKEDNLTCLLSTIGFKTPSKGKPANLFLLFTRPFQ